MVMEPYPVSKAAEHALKENIRGTAAKEFTGLQLAEWALEYIGEYEHGSVDLPEGTHLNVLAGIVCDFVGYVATLNTLKQRGGE